ncbi:MAG: sn-glycerol-1-phosphate dehydrogenase [Clostridia bacterium]|nr:sn-glycerol-1-phosphate dehydrogenase [Clostridia bacterium]
MSIKETLSAAAGKCECGKTHELPHITVESGKGAFDTLMSHIDSFGAIHPYILSDINTEAVAGKKVKEMLEKSGKAYTSCLFECDKPVPDEKSVGYAIMNYTPECDIIISVGSGVMNDIGKIAANVTGKPYILVATAPSMDGFASITSSVELNGLKTSLPSTAPNVVIGDTDILKTAPDIMLKAGLGDMLAKYISNLEWNISRFVTGEYYCEKVASLVKTALKICTDNAEALLNRDDVAIKAVFEGLVVSGISMNIAGCSRPASGLEHYFSHIWDMRALCFGTAESLHGINCAIGTREAYNRYLKLLTFTPDREKAQAYARNFNLDSWNEKLRGFIGPGAEPMIEAEKKDGKYNSVNHAKRLENIITNWDEIISIIKKELPDEESFNSIYSLAGIPERPEEIGIDKSDIPMTFLCTKDVRNKYILSSLTWDLGIIEDFEQ